MTPRRVAFLLTSALLFASGCGATENADPSTEVASEDSGESADAMPVTITTKKFKFQPDSLEGHATHAVALTLANKDDTAHSFTIDEMDVDVAAEGGKEEQTTFTPKEIGSFEFYCKYHPDTMKGEFEVS